MPENRKATTHKAFGCQFGAKYYFIPFLRQCVITLVFRPLSCTF